MNTSSPSTGMRMVSQLIGRSGVARAGRIPLALLVATLATIPSLQAASVTWDGNGTPDASGTWETGVNWSTDAIPGTADNARLLNVTTGTRTVTISSGSAQSINQLTMTQTTVGAFNVLDVNADLTLNGTGSGYKPFVITPTAGQGSIITNIGAGVTLKAAGNAAYTSDFAGTLNLADNSVFRLESTTAFKANFVGPINVTGTNAKMTFDSPAFVTNGPQYSGAITVSGVGSSLQIEKLAPTVAGTAMFAVFTGDDGSGNSINLGTGTRLDISDLDYTNIPFTNRVKLDADAILYIGSPTTVKTTPTYNNIDFNGGLAMGEDARTTVSLGNIRRLTLDDISSWESGSELLLQYRNKDGTAQLIQSGTLTMDGAALNFDYVSTTGENLNITRNYQNSGTWTMKNGASVAFISSGTNSTFGSVLGSYNNNTGTFNLESGSELGFRSYYNTGTMTVGSSTAGVSDATVKLGSPDNTFEPILLANGVGSGEPDAAATLNINGNALLGRTTDPTGGSSTLTFDNGSATSTGSVINVGDGTVDTTLTTSNRDVVITNYAGNTINLKANGTLFLKSVADNSVSSTKGDTTLTNDGTFVHAGTLMIQGAYTGNRDVTTSSTGLYRISGTDAELEALAAAPGSVSTYVSPVDFTVNGQLSGASASDKLTYVDSTGYTGREYLGLSVSGGEVTPGLGSNGAGTTSIGSLELVDTNLTLSSNATMTFDIGGTSGSGLFDQIHLTLATAGSGAVLDLGSNTTLDIRLVNGISSLNGTYLIATGDSRTGTFGTLLFNGAANAGEYSVNYLSNGVEIVGVIPEPSTAFLLLGGIATGLLVFRRRRVV